MAISSLVPVHYAGLHSSAAGINHLKNKPQTSTQAAVPEDLLNLAEELEELVSEFQVFSRNGKKTNLAEDDYLDAVLQDNAEEQYASFVKAVKSQQQNTSLLILGRGFFADESDLYSAMREMLLSRELEEFQKKNVTETMKELLAFGDRKKIISGSNIAREAKIFSNEPCVAISAAALRQCYLHFLDNPRPGMIYKYWIQEYGCPNRLYLLAFTYRALVADMKSQEPGMHFSEFGPLSAKFCDVRELRSLDELLLKKIKGLSFIQDGARLPEVQIVDLYVTGLIDAVEFSDQMKALNEIFLPGLHSGNIATLYTQWIDIFRNTPASLFLSQEVEDAVLDYLYGSVTRLCKGDITRRALY